MSATDATTSAAPPGVRGGAALVAGAAGVIGGAAAREHARVPGRTVRTVSRRPADGPGEHLAVDLLDPAAARGGLAGAGDTTHLVFAAYAERPDPWEAIAVNVALLRNTLDALRAAGAPLRHVTLYQGNKAYGAHLGPFKTPADERDPRLLGPNFYYDQEDLLRARAREEDFAWTVLRPEGVVGHTVGTPMNLLMALAAFAAICHEDGVPLRFPAGAAAYDTLYQVTDAELLARATVWAGDAPAARGEVFNVTNGDVFRWRQLWPLLARAFDVPVGEPQPMDLVEHMRGRARTWDARVTRLGLRPTPWERLVDFRFGASIMAAGYPNISNTTKLRRAGFGECLDTLDRMAWWFARLRRERLV